MANDVDDLENQIDFHQNISLNGNEHAHTLHGFEVNFFASKESSVQQVDSGSNKVKISTITNQNWELPTHHGKIVASNNKYLSYVLEGRNGYVLRLIQQETNNRALLKAFVGAVVDVAFWHANSNLLACVDQGGNVYVWDLDRTTEETQIQTEALKIIIQRSSTPDDTEHRLVWSPHVPSPEDEEDQDICNIIVTHGREVEIFDIHDIFSTYASGMKVPRDMLCCGVFSISDSHDNSIHDLSLSPDGSVLATASGDGHLKFWQVNWEKEKNEEPKCLHDFVPHGGAPVSRLIFCDNHLSKDPNNQYWRFLITGSKNNTEVKIWCTVNWKCLQTIRFFPSKDDVNEEIPHILLGVDLSASYLIATDSNRIAVYVLQLLTSSSMGDASVTSITEYLLTQPILSFNVADYAALQVYSDQEGCSGEESGEDDDVHRGLEKDSVFDSRRNVVLIKLHCVHTRSMQELLVRFEPPDLYGVPPSGESLKMLPSKESKDFTGGVASFSQPTSLPIELNDAILNTTPVKFHSLTSLNNSAGSPKLLTPSEFTSPAKAEVTVDNIPLHPLLSPASIMASAAQAGASILDDTMSDISVSKHISDQQNNESSSTQHTLTFVTSDVNNPATKTLEEHGEEVSEIKDKAEKVEHENDIVSNSPESFTKENKDSGSVSNAVNIPLPNETTSEEDYEPNTEDTQKAFDNIFELLNVEKPPSPSFNPQSYDKFTELLSDPVKLQEQERVIKVASEFVTLHNEPAQSEDEHSQIVNAAATKYTHPLLEMLKSTSNQGSLENIAADETMKKEIQESGTENLVASQTNENHDTTNLPVVEAVEGPVEDVAVNSLANECDLNIAESVEGSNSNQKSCQSPDIGLLMPAALSSDSQELLDVPVGSSEKSEFNTALKDIGEKTRSRRRARRSKKQNHSSTGPIVALDAPNYSVNDLMIPADPLLPVESNLTGGQSKPGVDNVSSDGGSLLSDLIQLVSDQQQLLRDIRSEQKSYFASLQDQLSVLKTSVSEEQKTGWNEFKIEQQQKLDRLLREKQTMDKQKQDKLITTLSHTLTTAVNAKLDKLIKMEMKNSIVPAIQQSVSSLHKELSGSIAHHLTATDVAIKEGINQLIMSKGLPDAIGEAMVASLQKTLPAMYEEVFKNVVLTSFEKSCQEMFRQVNEAFQKGTIEYLSQLQQNQYSLHESTLQHLLSSIQSMQSVLTSPPTPVSAHFQAIVQQEIASLSQHIQEVLAGVVSASIQKEIELQTTKLSTQREDKKEKVQELIQTKNYNSAFELALSTSDLQLVTYLCQQVDPDEMFDSPHNPLSQPVLLSLIQQLSVNLQESLELKVKYLDQCLLALDITDDVTKSHMVPVIQQLSQQMSSVQENVQSDPSYTPAIIKQIKRLRMVALQMCQ